MSTQPKAPIEAKVTAATTAGTITAAALWVLHDYVFHTDVPSALSALLTIGITAGVTFAAGYFTRHTPRTTP